MAKNKKSLAGRMMIFLVLVAIISLLIAFSNHFGAGSLRRIVYMIGSGVSGSAEETTIQFDANDLNRYHIFSGGLAVLSTDGLHIYKMSGKESLFTPLTYRCPSISGSKKTIAAYDRNGKSFTILNNKKTLLQKNTDAPIINLSMNQNGGFSVITAGPDCKSLVTVYNTSMKEVYKLYSSEQFVIDVAVANDMNRIAVLNYSAGSGQFSGNIIFYKLDEQKPYATIPLPDCMPLTAKFDSSGDLTVLCEDRILIIDKNGTKKADITFGGLHIQNASLSSSKLSSVLLDAYSVGGYSKLLLISKDAEKPKAINFSEDIFSISTAGRYTAVQFTNRITVYLTDGTEFHTFDLPKSARSCIMREDGTVLIIGSNYATLLIP